jgi:hypothetical protein
MFNITCSSKSRISLTVAPVSSTICTNSLQSECNVARSLYALLAVSSLFASWNHIILN